MQAIWNNRMVKGRSELDIDLNRVVSDPDYRRKVLQRLNAQRRAARSRPEWPQPPAGPDKGAGSSANDPTPPDGTTGAPKGGVRKRKSE